MKCSTAEKKEEFIRKAKQIKGHENIDYSFVEYKNNRTPVRLYDRSLRPDGTEYGEFWQTPSNHLKGQSHPDKRKARISSSKSISQDEIIRRFKLVHPNENLDYSHVEYVNMHTKVRIISHDKDENGKEYGEFWQEPAVHLKGCTHPRIGKKKQSESQTLTQDDFIERCLEVHKDDNYSYDATQYKNYRSQISVYCGKTGSNGIEHGYFSISAENFLAGKGCPKCGNHYSSKEDEIFGFISQYAECMKHEHSILNGKEIDIYIPSLRLGIEYNGLRWHTDFFGGKDKSYHISKLNDCISCGVRLIQIFEDEYINRTEIVLSKIKHIIGADTEKPKIFARQCTVSEISKYEARNFLSVNHIQGFAGSSLYLGLSYGDKTVAVMTFLREQEGKWNLNRFATDISCNCIGAGGKLFKYFIRNYEFNEIKSFADRRWTVDYDNNLYTRLGFEYIGFTPADYTYYNQDKERFRRFHKFGFRKQILHRKYGLPMTMTETEMIKELGYDRIWDCGLVKYVYRNCCK